jgi:outer membrane protein OmpA-like peptidoglycan-associated protein
VRFPKTVASAAALAALCFSALVEAEPLRVHGTLSLGHAVTGPQMHEYGWGATLQGAAEYPFGKSFGLDLELTALGLLEGDPPEDPRVRPESGASAFAAALGARYRPFAASYQGELWSSAGLWFAAHGGAATTNGLTRFVVNAALGYDFLDHKGNLGYGPALGYLHVFQPDSEFRPADANIVLVGLHVMFDFAPGLNPESDRDRDGIPDDLDRCPDDPEDKDGWADNDGCPDPDNDGDGILDLQDRCPLEAEDKDGFEDQDGCPEPDNDKDGILDTVDQCPNEPEDDDGWESLDGCPDPDNDGDGIVDIKDLCPFEPETVNGYADEDGCPDEEQVRVVGDKIVLDDRVHFLVNSAVIRHISYPLLERLAKLLGDHPEYTHIAIEGHADERGPESFNQKLSADRARSVLEFLVKKGIAAERLSSAGYGSSRPLVDKKNEYAYLLNRRVEFLVTRQRRESAGPPAQAPAPASPTPSSQPALGATSPGGGQ